VKIITGIFFVDGVQHQLFQGSAKSEAEALEEIELIALNSGYVEPFKVERQNSTLFLSDADGSTIFLIDAE
jgi:hypothetical protein